jgi:hypothetical protein
MKSLWARPIRFSMSGGRCRHTRRSHNESIFGPLAPRFRGGNNVAEVLGRHFSSIINETLRNKILGLAKSSRNRLRLPREWQPNNGGPNARMDDLAVQVVQDLF